MLQIHLSPTLALRDFVPLSSPTAGSLSVNALSTISNPTTTPAATAFSATKILIVSTPTDKTLLTNEGSSVWAVESGDIGEQIDDLVGEGRVLDAMGLAEAVGDHSLAPVSAYRNGKYVKLIAVTSFETSQDIVRRTTIRCRSIPGSDGYLSHL